MRKLCSMKDKACRCSTVLRRYFANSACALIQQGNPENQQHDTSASNPDVPWRLQTTQILTTLDKERTWVPNVAVASAIAVVCWWGAPSY